MSYAELIEKRLQTLPEAKRAEVFDFVEFLAIRNQAEVNEEHALARSPLADMMKNPLSVSGFTPLSREEANARYALRGGNCPDWIVPSGMQCKAQIAPRGRSHASNLQRGSAPAGGNATGQFSPRKA
ncbi:MAG: hypothetical protein WC091_25995 [Sulfuricellaceae bacterium]